MIQEAIKEHCEQLMCFGSGLMHFFVHRNGEVQTPIKHDLPMGEMKQCYRNAAQFALASAYGDGFYYAEGFAIRRSLGILMEHAWIVDRQGNAYDLTWKDAHECEYMGVVFKKKTLMRELRRNGVYGILNTGVYNMKLMQEEDEFLMQDFNTMVEQRKAWWRKQQALIESREVDHDT